MFVFVGKCESKTQAKLKIDSQWKKKTRTAKKGVEAMMILQISVFAKVLTPLARLAVPKGCLRAVTAALPPKV